MKDLKDKIFRMKLFIGFMEVEDIYKYFPMVDEDREFRFLYDSLQELAIIPSDNDDFKWELDMLLKDIKVDEYFLAMSLINNSMADKLIKSEDTFKFILELVSAGIENFYKDLKDIEAYIEATTENIVLHTEFISRQNGISTSTSTSIKESLYILIDYAKRYEGKHKKLLKSDVVDIVFRYITCYLTTGLRNGEKLDNIISELN